MRRPARSLLFAFLIAVLAAALLAACGGGSPDPPPRDYLVSTLRLQAHVTREGGVSFATVPDPFGDPLGALERSAETFSNQARLYGDTADLLADVVPPPEAEQYHQSLISVLRRLENALETMSNAAFLYRFLPDVTDEVLSGFNELKTINSDGRLLALRALASDLGDPLVDYLIAAIEMRVEHATEFGNSGTQSLLLSTTVQTTADLQPLAADFDELIASGDAFAERWQALAVPDETADLHRRQGEFFSDANRIQRNWADALPDYDIDFISRSVVNFAELDALGIELEVEWTELLITALEG